MSHSRQGNGPAVTASSTCSSWPSRRSSLRRGWVTISRSASRRSKPLRSRSSPTGSSSRCATLETGFAPLQPSPSAPPRARRYCWSACAGGGASAPGSAASRTRDGASWAMPSPARAPGFAEHRGAAFRRPFGGPSEALAGFDTLRWSRDDRRPLPKCRRTASPALEADKPRGSGPAPLRSSMP